MSLLVEMKFITYYAAARHGLQRAGGEGGEIEWKGIGKNGRVTSYSPP